MTNAHGHGRYDDPDYRRKQRESHLGKTLSEATILKIKEKRALQIITEETKLKLSAASLINQKGEKNGNYKGDSAGYDAIHRWVRTRRPNEGICEICGTSDKTLILACVGEYTRDITQFKWVCWGCHNKHDHENPRHPQKYFPNTFTENGQKIKRSTGALEIHE